MDIASIPDLSLAECLAIVEKHFDIQSIAARRIDQSSVLEYFKQSGRGYRLFHSRQGAMHVALNCDREFSTDGYLGQVDLLAERLSAAGARQVLEIGCGVGYNTRHLAERLCEATFTGLDLSEKHVADAARDAKRIDNVTFRAGDFQSLPFDDAAFDAVIAVESLCQSADMQRALGEAYRVLRPGGQLMVIDCFRSTPLEQYDDDTQLAVQLVEKTMAVPEFAVVDEWIADAQTIGLVVQEQQDLSDSISHNVARFYSLARRFYKMPRAARAFLKAFPERLLENSISGLLMPFTVESGAHRYYLCVLERADSQ